MSKISLNNNTDLNKINTLCLKAIKIIDENICLQKKYKDAFNLTKIFYHEIIQYSTNIILIKNSIYKNSDDLNFPYINSNYILRPKKIKFTTKNDSFLDNLNFGLGKKKIFLSRNLHVKKKIFLNLAPKKKLKLNYYSSINLPDYEYQLETLKNILKKIMIFLNLKNKIFVDNFINYVKNTINFNKQKDLSPKNSVLIVGSNMNIENRIVSAKFLQEDTNKVISINHSVYPFYVYNEPVRNIEYSFCSDYISYGNFDFSKKIKNKIFFTPKLHFANNDTLNNLPKTKRIKNFELDKNLKYLYVPNMMNGNIRYGPFRDIEDKIYYKFQSDLLNTFQNTMIKIHPKGKKLFFDQKRLSENVSFEKIYNNYEVYIFDYFSTPFAKAIATNKPIIYFDIGLRNLEKEVLNIIKKRVYYCKIDLNKNLKDQFKKFLINISIKNDKKINLFTEKFLINKNNENINSIIEKIL